MPGVLVFIFFGLLGGLFIALLLLLAGLLPGAAENLAPQQKLIGVVVLMLLFGAIIYAVAHMASLAPRGPAQLAVVGLVAGAVMSFLFLPLDTDATAGVQRVQVQTRTALPLVALPISGESTPIVKQLQGLAAGFPDNILGNEFFRRRRQPGFCRHGHAGIVHLAACPAERRDFHADPVTDLAGALFGCRPTAHAVALEPAYADAPPGWLQAAGDRDQAAASSAAPTAADRHQAAADCHQNEYPRAYADEHAGSADRYQHAAADRHQYAGADCHQHAAAAAD